MNEFAFQASKQLFRSHFVDSPLINLGFLLLVGYVFQLWLSDLKAAKAGKSSQGSLPGALPSSINLILIGVAGALLLVAGETVGESMLAISSEQSSMTVLFALVTIAAGFGEELIFRGYLIIQNRGRATLWAGIFGFSALFALIHPYLWEWEDGSLSLQLNTKAWFSTAVVFLNSLWFYYLRINAANPNRSLWPCIAAHAASNAAVFFVKLAQGHVSGLY